MLRYQSLNQSFTLVRGLMLTDSTRPIRLVATGLLLLVMLIGASTSDSMASELPSATVATTIEAAKNGNVDAQYRLAIMHAFGMGVEYSEAESARWYRKAGEQGHVDAQYSLGALYELGIGVEQNDVEAMKWYRLAAEAGDMEAKQQLEYLSRGN